MATLLNAEGLASALALEFGTAVEAALGPPVTVSTAAPSAGPGWGTPITATGALTGALIAHLDGGGVSAIARQMMGLEEEPDDPVVADMLRSLWSQAAAAVTRRDGFEGVTLTPGTPVAGDADSEPESGAGAWVVRSSDAIVTRLSVTGVVVAGAAAAAPAPGAGTARGLATPGSGASPGNLAALLDIDLPLVVRFARTELSLRELTALGPGSMVDMGRSPDDPVQLLVGTQVIAEGEVVVVAGNYGVRITSLVSQAERLKAMEL